MFTVKHITWHAPSQINAAPDQPSEAYQVEKLYEAGEITFCPEEHDMGYLQLRNGDTFIAGLFGGIAYVMNDHGKTISRYDIPAFKADLQAA